MNEKFNYTYSAKERAEIEAIRKKYESPVKSSDKLAELKRLDKQAELPGTLTAVGIGVFGTLILGTGLALILKTIFFITGLCIGILGLSIMASALPAFRKITQIRRKQLAPEIFRLSEELEKEI